MNVACARIMVILEREDCRLNVDLAEIFTQRRKDAEKGKQDSRVARPLAVELRSNRKP